MGRVKRDLKKWNKALGKWLRISPLSKHAGQVSIAKKEWEKKCSARMQDSGKVLSGDERVPSSPIAEIGEGNLRPE